MYINVRIWVLNKRNAIRFQHFVRPQQTRRDYKTPQNQSQITVNQRSVWAGYRNQMETDNQMNKNETLFTSLKYIFVMETGS